MQSKTNFLQLRKLASHAQAGWVHAHTHMLIYIVAVFVQASRSDATNSRRPASHERLGCTSCLNASKSMQTMLLTCSPASQDRLFIVVN